MDLEGHLSTILRDLRSLLIRAQADVVSRTAQIAVWEVNNLLLSLADGSLPAYADVAKMFSIGGWAEEAAEEAGYRPDFLAIAARFETLRCDLLVRHLGPIEAGARQLRPICWIRSE